MSISQNFPEIAPSLDLSFALTKKLDPRVTFSRASSATYYGTQTAKAEENLLLYSQEFDNAVWAKGNSTVTANATSAPDGTTTAEKLVENTATAAHRISRSNSVAVSTEYVYSVFAKADTRDWIALSPSNPGVANHLTFFDLANGVVGTNAAGNTATIENVGNGWYRCIIKRTTTGSQTSIDTQIYVASADNTSSYTGDGTSGIFIWGAQLEQRSAVTAYTPTTTQPITNYIPVLQTASAGVARFDHNPLTFESLGLLVEEQRTNLVVRSEEFDNASWSKGSNTTITANQNIAPDGTLSADKFGYTAITSGVLQVQNNQTKAASAIAYSGSIYVKASSGLFLHLFVDANSTANSGRVIVNTSNWTIFSTTNTGTFTGTSGTVTPVGNGWYRISCTTTSGTETNIRFNLYWSTANNTVTFTPVGTENVFIWGAQLEVGAFPTSYIKTEASQVTRSAESASMTGANFSSWYRQDEGTLYAESIKPTGSLPIIFSINDNTTANRLDFLYVTAENLRLRSIANNVNDVALTKVTDDSGFVKAAGAFKFNDFSFTESGESALVDTSGLLPLFTQLNIASASTGVSVLNGHIRKLAYYPQRLTNTQLQAITG